jgi:SnoaL-like domain
MDDVITRTVDTYFDMWNEPDADKRAEHIARAWAEDARYVDPLLEATGHEELGSMVAAVHAQYPGHRFSRVSRIDAHHDQVRFAWELDAPDGTLTAAGIDVGELAPDGRLRRIAGFFDEAAA